MIRILVFDATRVYTFDYTIIFGRRLDDRFARSLLMSRQFWISFHYIPFVIKKSICEHSLSFFLFLLNNAFLNIRVCIEFKLKRKICENKDVIYIWMMERRLGGEH